MPTFTSARLAPREVRLEHAGVTWSVEHQHAFARALTRLQDRLDRYDLPAERLVATFTPEGTLVRARLDLSLPGNAQTAMVVESSTERALQSAFATLFRRFDAYTWSFDRGRWRPLTGRLPDREEDLRRYHDALMRYALPALHRLAAHDVDRLRDDELLSEDWLDPAEIVDAAIADRLPSLDGSLDLPRATLELVRAVREELLARVQEIHEHQRSDISLEDPMQEDLELTKDETGDFPIDLASLCLGDVLGDPSQASPEEVVAEREGREELVTALFLLREPDRALFTQVVVDGWADDVVAAAWNITPGRVQRAVGRAAIQLSRALGDAEPEDVIDRYRGLGARLSEERKGREVATTR